MYLNAIHIEKTPVRLYPGGGLITTTAADREKYEISSLLFVSTHMHKLRYQDHAGVTYEHWSHADFKFMEKLFF